MAKSSAIAAISALGLAHSTGPRSGRLEFEWPSEMHYQQTDRPYPRTRLVAIVRELAEVHEQQASAGEILGIISRAPTDLQPVLGCRGGERRAALRGT
jgi:hypothetical protein